MSEELIPISKNRPAVLTIDGWTVFVSIRDAEYWRMLKQWKRRLAEVHPDRFPPEKAKTQNRKFRLLMGQRLRWQIGEAKQYAEWGLLPPDGFRHAEGLLERRKRLKGER